MDQESSKKIIIDDYKTIMDRIMPVTGIKNLTQLARIINIPQATVSRKKNLNKFEIEWAYLLSIQFDLSIDWILTGKERKIAVAQDRDGSSKNTEERDSKGFFKEIVVLQEWLFEVCRNEPERRAWFKVELMDKFPKFSAWLKDREVKEAEEKKGEFVGSGDGETVT
jgi:hypothetical protein